DRQVAAIGRERAQHVQVALRHHLQRNRRRAVNAVAEVQPLVVVLVAQPVGRELDQLGAVQRQELHSYTNFPSRSSEAPVRFPLRRVRATQRMPDPPGVLPWRNTTRTKLRRRAWSARTDLEQSVVERGRLRVRDSRSLGGDRLGSEQLLESATIDLPVCRL